MVDIMGTGSETSTAGGSPPAHPYPGDCMYLVEQVDQGFWLSTPSWLCMYLVEQVDQLVELVEQVQWLFVNLLFSTHLKIGSEAVP